jgi:hypothetical protein
MRVLRRIALLGMFAMLALASQSATAQGDKKTENAVSAAQSENAAVNKPLSVYRLDFGLSEFLDGKKVNTRNYSVILREDEMNKLRSGARYPVATGTGEKIINTQYQYLDVGVSIDCRVVERGGYLELNAVVDSSVIEGADAHGVPNPGTGLGPVIGQMKSDIRSLIRPGTPTMVSSMEDPASKRRFELDVTATKVN